MKNNLYILAKEAQYDNKEALMVIIKKFNPLIKKYSRKLDYDGADTDLTINLIEVIKKLPLCKNSNLKKEEYIVGYIAKSLKYHYIKLSKKYSKLPQADLELNEEILGNELDTNIELNILLRELLDKLPQQQKKILEEIFLKDKKTSEIAEHLHISRQAVNKTKIRALKNLKTQLNSKWLC